MTKEVQGDFFEWKMVQFKSWALLNQKSNFNWTFFLVFKYIPLVALNMTLLIMKLLSLKLDEPIFMETEEILKEKGIPRNRYINEALDFYNRYHKRKKIAKAFAKASALVRESSMEINAEFDQLIDEEAIWYLAR